MLNWSLESFWSRQHPSQSLNYSAIVLYQPVHYLLCLHLNRSCLPQEWRTHQIISIHKTNSRETSVNNYYTISLLLLYFEGAGKNSIWQNYWLFTNSIISSSQFGSCRRDLLSNNFLSSCLIFSILLTTRFKWTIYLDPKKLLTRSSTVGCWKGYGLLARLENHENIWNIPEQSPAVCINQRTQIWCSSSNIWCTSG